jgi:succinate dehydrogenase / fumarate reductase iron-sulfur subunit
MSFLEMLDVVNEGLIKRGEEQIAFDHDCREGICGMCSLVINGTPHGPLPATTTCQLHMRFFKDGDTITIEPWRAAAFPVIKDLVTDRSAFDRVIQSGGYVSAHRMAMPCQFPKMMRTSRLMQRLALAVALASRRAKIVRQCCLFRPKSLT